MILNMDWSEWVTNLEKVVLMEGTVDWVRMKDSDFFRNGIVLPRKMNINGHIQVSTLQEFACRDEEGLNIGKEAGPRNCKRICEKPLKKWEDQVLQSIEEVWEEDNGQGKKHVRLNADPLEHVKVGEQHKKMKEIYLGLQGNAGRERIICEKEGILRLSSHYQEVGKRQRLDVIEDRKSTRLNSSHT